MGAVRLQRNGFVGFAVIPASDDFAKRTTPDANSNESKLLGKVNGHEIKMTPSGRLEISGQEVAKLKEGEVPIFVMREKTTTNDEPATVRIITESDGNFRRNR